MVFHIRDRRRTTRQLSFETLEEAYAYVCAVVDFGGSAGPAEWALVKADEGETLVLGPGELLERARAWAEAHSTEKSRRPGFDDAHGTAFA